MDHWKSLVVYNRVLKVHSSYLHVQTNNGAYETSSARSWVYICLTTAPSKPTLSSMTPKSWDTNYSATRCAHLAIFFIKQRSLFYWDAVTVWNQQCGSTTKQYLMYLAKGNGATIPSTVFATITNPVHSTVTTIATAGNWSWWLRSFNGGKCMYIYTICVNTFR